MRSMMMSAWFSGCLRCCKGPGRPAEVQSKSVGGFRHLSARCGTGGFYLASFCAGRRAPWSLILLIQTGRLLGVLAGRTPAAFAIGANKPTHSLPPRGWFPSPFGSPGESGIDRQGSQVDTKATQAFSRICFAPPRPQTSQVQRSGSPESPSPSSNRCTKICVQITDTNTCYVTQRVVLV